jgi:myo-inositol 2-dehydrogenase/D-chiro-inositol 1-dehydrogenase
MMAMPSNRSRRGFLSTLGAGALAAGTPAFLGDLCYGARAPADRRQMGLIGAGGQGYHLLTKAREFADLVAVADVDGPNARRAAEQFDPRPQVYEDYRQLLDRRDIDVVLIATPDHWHARAAIDAMRAGKDVYCEKPLALTVAEGQAMVRMARATGRIVQVGTQQRSEFDLRFLRAVATVRSGQLGVVRKVTVSLPLSTLEGGPFRAQKPPKELNWDFWLGQAPAVPYSPERCHGTFRWWYEYSGGIVTDWGAHHLDIAQWALDVESSGPLAIDGRKTHMPAIVQGYNTPREPRIEYRYPRDVVLELTTGKEFVRFEGDAGRIEVSRQRLEGDAFKRQDSDPALADAVHSQMSHLYGGRKPGSHLRNFFECVASREPPVSAIEGQHRSATACHLGNISCRLGEALVWDPARESFVGSDRAQEMLVRTQRLPYSVTD